MTRKKKIIILAVAVWILGAVYLAPKAMNELRADVINAIEGRAPPRDGMASWNHLRGIAFPSLIEYDDDDYEDDEEQE